MHQLINIADKAQQLPTLIIGEDCTRGSSPISYSREHKAFQVNSMAKVTEHDSA